MFHKNINIPEAASPWHFSVDCQLTVCLQPPCVGFSLGVQTLHPFEQTVMTRQKEMYQLIAGKWNWTTQLKRKPSSPCGNKVTRWSINVWATQEDELCTFVSCLCIQTERCSFTIFIYVLRAQVVDAIRWLRVLYSNSCRPVNVPSSSSTQSN